MGCVMDKVLCCENCRPRTDIDYPPKYLKTKSKKHYESTTREFTDRPIDQMYKTSESKFDTEKSALEIVQVTRSSQIKIKKSSFVMQNSGLPSEYYELVTILGEGSFGTVCEVVHKFTGEIRVMKIISKDILSKGYTMKDLEAEINILKKLDHPNIIKVFESFQDSSNFYIISELCSEGNLFEKLEKMVYINEQIVKMIMFEILTAVAYLHNNKVIHGDLKLENIMIDKLDQEHKESFTTSIMQEMEENKLEQESKMDSCNLKYITSSNLSGFGIKLIDFGCSKIFSKSKKKFSEIIGTLNYCAPEVILNKYDEKCDIWACGVIMFVLLSGRMPFKGKNEMEICENILRKEINFDEVPEFQNISSTTKNFMKKLLTYDPKARPSASECLSHAYFKHKIESSRNLSQDFKVQKNILLNLQNYSVNSKFLQAVLTFLTYNFAKKDEIFLLRKSFRQIDINNDGRISKDELLLSYKKCGVSLNSQQLDNILIQIDTDQSGYVEYEEFIKGTINKKNLFTESNLKHAFDLFDHDRNGTISLEEIKSLLECNLPDEVGRELLREINKKDDEEINFEDFKLMMHSLITS
jgi:calcium-dependent protein kinase